MRRTRGGKDDTQGSQTGFLLCSGYHNRLLRIATSRIRSSEPGQSDTQRAKEPIRRTRPAEERSANGQLVSLLRSRLACFCRNKQRLRVKESLSVSLAHLRTEQSLSLVSVEVKTESLRKAVVSQHLRQLPIDMITRGICGGGTLQQARNLHPQYNFNKSNSERIQRLFRPSQ